MTASTSPSLLGSMCHMACAYMCKHPANATVAGSNALQREHRWLQLETRDAPKAVVHNEVTKLQTLQGMTPEQLQDV